MSEQEAEVLEHEERQPGTAVSETRGTGIMQAAEAGDPMMRMVAAAMSDSAVDVEKLERLMDMRDREMARCAREEYMRAMTSAQSEMRNVKADARNDQTGSNYAKLDGIIKVIRPIYTRHGLSLSFSTDECPVEGHMRVVCDVMHQAGHCERKHVDIPIDLAGIKGNQNKTATHAHGSTMSYARRYLTLLIFNLATGDDDDGNVAAEMITTEQAINLRERLEACGADVDAFKRWAKVESLTDIRASTWPRVLKAVEQKEAQAGA